MGAAGAHRLLNPYKVNIMAYSRQVLYLFEVEGEQIAACWTEEDGEDAIRVEETRKNGQEDTHMNGILVHDHKTGSWVWAEMWGSECESFSDYHSKGLADGIVNYINQHPLPSQVPF